MRKSAWIGAMVVMLVLAGCRRQAVDETDGAASLPPPPQPMSDQERARIAVMTPGAIVGRIVAVTTAHRMVAVGDVSAPGIREGDAFVLMGAEGVLGTAVVVSTDRKTLYLRYEQVTRDPIVGDLALRFP